MRRKVNHKTFEQHNALLKQNISLGCCVARKKWETISRCARKKNRRARI